MKQTIAYLALLALPPFALYVFKRMPKAHAAAAVVLVGSLLLPEYTEIDFPVVPPMDKEYITYLSVLLGAFVHRRKFLRRGRFGTGLETAIVLMFFASVGTMLANPNPMMDEGKLEDGLGLYWLIAHAVDDVLTIAVPFFVGRALFTTLEDLHVLMGAMVIAGVGYTVLIGIETLLSIPFRVWQLSLVVYGIPIHPHFRWGMPQPVVFFENGLALATFMGPTLIAAAALSNAGLPIPRFRRRSRIPQLGPRFARTVLTVGLVLTLNVAGIVYGLTFLALHLLFRARLISLAAVALVTLAIVYPSLRMADLFPYQDIVDFAAQYDADRARSLGGRFDEEEHVLSHIGDRLWVGWGNVSRTPGAETFGEGEAGLDGWWTIRLGSAGVLGVLLYYMMFAIPVFRAWPVMGRAGPAGMALVCALMCMISLRMVDLIINGWWNCLPVFLAGVLAGVTRSLKRGRA